ncbi:MAG: aldose 1-epimerase, partial [Oscillospiraceae bacterium]
RRWLPNGRNLKLNTYDKEYVNSGKRPVLSDICNDMYVGTTIDHNGTQFCGTIMTDTASGKSILNEVDENYKFWIIWNDKGFKNYFCAEPMTAQVNAPNLDMPAEKSGYTEIGPGGSYSAWQRFFTEV